MGIEKLGIVLVATDEIGEELQQAMWLSGYRNLDFIRIGQEHLRKAYVKEGYVLIYIGGALPDNFKKLPKELSMDLTEAGEGYIAKCVGPSGKPCVMPTYHILMSICSYVSNTILHGDIADLKNFIKCKPKNEKFTFLAAVDAKVEDTVEYIKLFLQTIRDRDFIKKKGILFQMSGDVSLNQLNDVAESVMNKMSSSQDLLLGLDDEVVADNYCDMVCILA